MESVVLLVIGIAVLVILVIAFIVVNESKKRAREKSAEETTRRLLQERNDIAAAQARQLELDPDEIRAWLDESYEAACIIEPPCPGTTEVDEETGCCAMTDEQLTKFDKAVIVTQSILREVFISIGFEKVVSTAYKLSKAGTRVTRQMVQRASTRMGRVAMRSASKTAMKASSRFGLRLLTKAGSKIGLGPVGIAWLAYEVISMALDLGDPFGFNTYAANEVSKTMRNAFEVEMQRANSEGDIDSRTDYPLTFPLALAFPEHGDDFIQALTARFTTDAFDLMSTEQQAQFFLSIFSEESEIDDSNTAFDDFIDALFLVLNVKTIERDEFIYNFYKDKGLESQIERVPFMSTPKREGVTLSKEGVDKYNARMEDLHFKHAGFDRQGEYCGADSKQTKDSCVADAYWQGDGYRVLPDGYEECKWDEETQLCIKKDQEGTPADYLPIVALYTDKYRVVDPNNPGEASKPNVIEKTLEKKCALMTLHGSVVQHCVGLGRTVGVTYNYEKGYCNYTQDFCKSYAMNYNADKEDCEMRPGQDLANSIFGTTITSGVIILADEVEDVFNELGDCATGVFTGDFSDCF